MTKQQYAVIFQRYLAVVSLFLIFVGVNNVRLTDPWAMGDWLINYSGGFMRRGLLGQGILDVSRLPLHLSPYVLVFVVQLGCYALIFTAVAHLLRGMAWRTWMILFVYSPATLSFTVLNPGGAFRKEILFLALLAFVIVALSIFRVSLPSISVGIAVGMMVLVLSHEAMVFYYPYIVCALILTTRSVKRACIASIPGALTGLAAFLAAATHPGSRTTANAICSSIGGKDLETSPCNGAIWYLGRSRSVAHADVMGTIPQFHLKLVFPFLLVMSLIPICMSLAALWKEREEREVWWAFVICAGSSWLATILLFMYGVDWDRWVYVHIFSSLLLLLMIERRHQHLTQSPQREILPGLQPARAIAVVLIAFSMVGWQLSYYHHFPLPAESLLLYAKRLSLKHPYYPPHSGSPP